MKAKRKQQAKTHEKGTTQTSFCQNNIGTLGQVSSGYVDGRGSFKKLMNW